jgi:hypothetical protein
MPSSGMFLSSVHCDHLVHLQVVPVQFQGWMLQILSLCIRYGQRQLAGEGVVSGVLLDIIKTIERGK